MVDPHDPSAVPPSQPAAPPTYAPAPPKKGMSTGAKIGIGCGALLVLGIVGFVILGVVGGRFVKSKTDQLTGGLEAQEEATESIQELERDHPFTAPADGIVTNDLADDFFAVTDDAWEGMREEMEDVAERGQDIEERGGEAGIGDAMAGVQALGRARVALAEALDEHEMPVSAYLWTGMELMRAYHAIGMAPDQSGVPAQNVQLAESHRAQLAEIAEENEGQIGKGMVLGMAWTWGAGEGVMPMGWDTMNTTP
jgi:hypothetical protein